jgi:Bacteriophage probable baseplate hub protein
MQPDFQVLADKKDITAVIRDRLLSLRITDEAGTQSDTVEVQLDDRDGKLEWPRLGAELEVSIGYQTNGIVRMGLYVVDEIEHSGPPATLTIRGKAADMRASIKAQKTRSWDKVTIGDLVQTIASENGLTAKVSDSLSNISIEHIDQTNESDLHLLTRLARERGAVAKPVAGRLVFVPRGEAKSATGQSMPVVDIETSDISRYRMTQAEREKYPSVKAYWHDSESAEKISVIVGEGKPAFSIRHTYANAEEARQVAVAKLKTLNRGTGSVSLTLVGNPDIQVEGKIKLSGVRDPVDGEWLVCRVEHQLSGQGFVTRCDAEIPNS